MGLNSQLHLKINSELFEKLQKEALVLGMTVSELCRIKLGKPSPLSELIERIETLIKIFSKK